ncbi:unnamed protein product [Trichobilharzia regenti]|nr:unnamed protein product [Trichobilharzia regenti]
MIPLPRSNSLIYNSTVPNNVTAYAKFTSLNGDTLKENVLPMYSTDYTTGSVTSFVIVFSVLFSGVTGIMNGANVSGMLILPNFGELKNPSRSIPLGTLSALLCTALIYLIMIIFSAASNSPVLRPAKWTTKRGNPIVAVLTACFLCLVSFKKKAVNVSLTCLSIFTKTFHLFTWL